MAAESKVKLKGEDHDEIFEVDKAVAEESQVLKDLIEDVGVEGLIPLPNVKRDILAKILEYCSYHVEAIKMSKDSSAIKQWDKEFMKVDHKTLFRLLRAADYLNIKNLLDLTSQTLAEILKEMTKSSSPEEIRKAFNIKDDLTPEEKEEVRKDFHWGCEEAKKAKKKYI